MATGIPSLAQQLAGQWKADWSKNTRLGPAKAHFDRVLAVQEKLAAERDRLAKNLDLSDTGRLASLRKFAEKEVVPHVAKAIRAIDQNETHLQRRRMSLLPTVKDPTNVAAAILRSEMRGHIAAMKPGDRIGLLTAPDTDPRLLEAVVEAPISMTGMTKAENELILKLVTERTHGPAAAAIEEEAEALVLVRAMTQIATNDLAKAAQLPHTKSFTEWLEATAEAAGVLKTEDAEIAALSVNVIADHAATLSPVARRTLIDTLTGQQATALTRAA